MLEVKTESVVKGGLDESRRREEMETVYNLGMLWA